MGSRVAETCAEGSYRVRPKEFRPIVGRYRCHFGIALVFSLNLLVMVYATGHLSGGPKMRIGLTGPWPSPSPIGWPKD